MTTSYGEIVARTIARLASTEARPAPEPIAPDASRVVHYCPACGLSWRGPAPCWGCDAPAVEHSDLTVNERALWLFSNASSGTFTEGATP